MKWTKEKPTIDGFYWYRFSPHAPTHPVEIKDGLAGLIGSRVWMSLTTVKGYFYGPVEPPPFDADGD